MNFCLYFHRKLMKLINDILTRFNLKHNSFYAYSIKEYKSITDKILIICPIHGEFTQTIANHFNHGCYECAKIHLANIKRGNLNNYLAKCNVVHGFKYDYSKIIFNKLKDKVEIICPIHGSFSCSLDNHMNKKIGCKKCTKRKNGEKEFFEHVKRRKENYDYSKVNYINSSTSVEIICQKHGSFWQIPGNHINKNHICPQCSLEQKSLKLMGSLNNYLDKLNIYHNNKYDYSKFIYSGLRKKSTIICPIHGEFQQSIFVHLNCGCPICNESHVEKLIRNYLIKNNIKFTTQKIFKDCKNTRNLLFDFYLNDFNICIEFDGIQHYGIKKSYDYDFELVKKRDDIKTQYCILNNIELIRIPYFNKNNIGEILSKLLKYPVCKRDIFNEKYYSFLL